MRVRSFCGGLFDLEKGALTIAAMTFSMNIVKWIVAIIYMVAVFSTQELPVDSILVGLSVNTSIQLIWSITGLISIGRDMRRTTVVYTWMFAILGSLEYLAVVLWMTLASRLTQIFILAIVVFIMVVHLYFATVLFAHKQKWIKKTLTQNNRVIMSQLFA